MSTRTNRAFELRKAALGRAGSAQKSTSLAPRKMARNVDSESSRPRVTPPTYGFVDQQTGDKDVSADPSTDEKVNDAVDRPTADDTEKSTTLVAPKSRAPGTSTRAPEPSTSSVSGSSSVYLALWSSASPIGITAIVKPKFSSFVPSSHLMFWYLFVMDRILWNNSSLEKINSHYLSLANYIYYGVLFHVQILRTMADAKIGITKKAGSWLRAFLRSNPLESLPIAGPLVPLFNALAAVKTEDPMYTWITPFFNFDNYAIANYSSQNQQFLLPQVGPMLAAFHLMLTEDLDSTIDTTAAVTTGTAVPAVTAPSHFDSKGNFIPKHLGPAAAHSFYGLDFVKNDATNKGIVRLPGLMHPPVEDKAQIKERRRYWTGTETADILHSSPPRAAAQSFDAFVNMDSLQSWFQEFAEQAADQARFFKGSTNMSNISLTSGNETLVKMTMLQSDNDKSTKRNAAWYTDGSWQDKGRMTTTSGDTTREEFLTAGITQLNVEYPAAGNTNTWGLFAGLGSRTSASALRKGAYFENELVQLETESNSYPTATIRSVIKNELFDPKGKASS